MIKTTGEVHLSVKNTSSTPERINSAPRASMPLSGSCVVWRCSHLPESLTVIVSASAVKLQLKSIMHSSGSGVPCKYAFETASPTAIKSPQASSSSRHIFSIIRLTQHRAQLSPLESGLTCIHCCSHIASFAIIYCYPDCGFIKRVDDMQDITVEYRIKFYTNIKR